MPSGPKTRAKRSELSESEARRAFRASLERTQRDVEKKLVGRWSRELKRLTRIAPQSVSVVEAARDLALRGGKRFRAALVMTAFRGAAPRSATAPALLAACSIELLQTYFLIQDDWMDGDEERRGGPSVHVVLAETLQDADRGAASAILASDFVFGMAQQVLLEAAVPPARKVSASQVLLAAHQEVVIGQILDIANLPDNDVSRIHDLKTASYTTRAPLLLGATIAGAKPDVLRSLERFARPLGLAFQLRDDLLGIFGSAQHSGRAPGSDLRAGKLTSVVQEAHARMDKKSRAAVDRVFGRPRASSTAMIQATQAIEACGARAAVSERLWSLCDKAEALAAALPLNHTARTELRGAASTLRPGPEEKWARASKTPSSPKRRGKKR